MIYQKVSADMKFVDREKEVEYQLRTTKAKLEAMGIVTEDLDI